MRFSSQIYFSFAKLNTKHSEFFSSYRRRCGDRYSAYNWQRN